MTLSGSICISDEPYYDPELDDLELDENECFEREQARKAECTCGAYRYSKVRVADCYCGT